MICRNCDVCMDYFSEYDNEMDNYLGGSINRKKYDVGN